MQYMYGLVPHAKCNSDLNHANRHQRQLYILLEKLTINKGPNINHFGGRHGENDTKNCLAPPKEKLFKRVLTFFFEWIS